MSGNKPQLLATNNFDLLRLLFALTVCLVHVHQISGYQQLAWIDSVLSSAVAVKAFFVVSGFLIFMSFEGSSSIASYAEKRFRRIYPAYLTVVMACAVGLIGVSSKDISNYFSLAWVKYVLANISFLNFLAPGLPGVFESHRFSAINGALWTLKIEVMFYLSVPLLVFLFRKFGHFSVMALTYLLSSLYAMGFVWAAERTGSGIYLELGRQLPGQLSYFIAGAFFYYNLPIFKRYSPYFIVGAILVLAASSYRPLPLLEPFALATVVIFFGLFLYVGRFGKYGDFSYGMYILHFPIIQCFIHFGWLANSPLLFLIATVLATSVAAIAMWHLVEKRFLLRSSHYVTTTISVTKMATS